VHLIADSLKASFNPNDTAHVKNLQQKQSALYLWDPEQQLTRYHYHKVALRKVTAMATALVIVYMPKNLSLKFEFSHDLSFTQTEQSESHVDCLQQYELHPLGGTTLPCSSLTNSERSAMWMH